MKNILTIAFIVTLLCSCGGELGYQNNASADKASSTEQGTMKNAAVEKTEPKDQQIAETDEASAEQTTAESKSDSAIKMIQGLARSMY